MCHSTRNSADVFGSDVFCYGVISIVHKFLIRVTTISVPCMLSCTCLNNGPLGDV
jgi:hypothetical protein